LTGSRPWLRKATHRPARTSPSTSPSATRRLADVTGPDVDQAPKVLIVTTFNVDEYVYRALRAGASGFLLKDTPLVDLCNGIRTVMRGESLLAPATAGPDPLEALAPGSARSHPIAQGVSNAEIAAAMVISRETVKTYVSRILTKLNLRDRVQAVVLAYRTGLATTEP
jgi:DNA-binding NarL/FixJ family response regulator